ncbi:MAG TPA: LD-carboxypeptidase [Thermotogota bacterium]|nr:LD-carboxypeptidase [Thermotogota bacterium]HPB88438.1 LD-carboxypeptidase [Thermotogota bacterium]HQN23232.1 LD-carboxypeptidase [Thermotogota bacterium]HQQ67142.1 LD-carboxypeptidase [Thermotogota bacterium]
MIKPKKLNPGDTIAVLSPSSGVPHEYPHIFDHGLNILKTEFWFRIKEYPTTRMNPKALYENPKARADDMNQAFLDKEVRGIICSIGGDDSVRILKHLNTEAILKHPKFIMGFSDSTTFLAYLNKLGLVTYYGPSVMAGFSYLNCFPEAAEEYRKVFFENPLYDIKPFTVWADAYQRWENPENTGKVIKKREDHIPHVWINKGTKTTGCLWGGCLEVLDMINGTFAWPETTFWSDRILMIETSEDKPSPKQVGYRLRNYGAQGILSSIRGLLIGKPKDYTDGEMLALYEEVKKVVAGEYGCDTLNIVANIGFGHTDPHHILPMGVPLTIDPEKETLIFTETMFSIESGMCS